MCPVWLLLLVLSCDRAPAVPAYTALPISEPERVDGLASIELGGVPALVVATTNPTELRWFTSVDSPAAGAIALSASGPLLAPGDLDQDGHADLVVAAELERVTLLVYAGGPAGLEVEPLVSIETRRHVDPEDLPPTERGIASGDFDADGIPDIAVGSHSYWGLRGVRVYSGVDVEVAALVEDDCYGFGEAVAGAGDVDADGYDDAVASGWCGVQVLPGGAESLGTLVDHGGQEVACYGPGDLDDDGFADVLCTDEWDYVPTLGLYRGSPSGLVAPTEWSTYLEWVEPPDFARRDADHDGDGVADLVIGWGDADISQGGVLVYAGGSSDLQLALPGQEAGRRLGDEVVADLDLDLDGRPDIVTTASSSEDGTEEVRVYRGAELW